MAQKTSREYLLRKERRMVRVPISLDKLVQTLLDPTASYHLSVPDLPHDAIFLHAYTSPEHLDVFLIFAHELFEQVTEGEQLPVWQTAIAEARKDPS